jgi:molybdate transport system substrate-binding protein
MAKICAMLSAACALAFTLWPAEAVAQEPAIHVICSNGFHAAMEKLRPVAERKLNRKIDVQFGASANLKRSIEGGEPFDLAILTSAIIEDLTKEGKIADMSAVDLASTGIGIAVRAGRAKPDVTTADAVKKTLLQAKSIGYVQVGAGTPAILNMLDHLGIRQDLQAKTISQPGAEQSMASVAGGQVELALALVSEILSAPGVQFAGPIPSEFQKRITMTAGISNSTKNRAAVNQIIQSFTSAEAAGPIKTAGMDPIAKEK